MIKEKRKNFIKEYLMFNLSGTLIFLICQIVYLSLLLKHDYSYILASIICTIISSILNYIFNSFIVFKTEKHSLLKMIQIIGIYFFESLPNSLILIIIVEIFKVPEALSTMVAPVIMTPIMFLLSKKILKKE